MSFSLSSLFLFLATYFSPSHALIPALFPSVSVKSWTSNRSLRYHLCYSLKEDWLHASNTHSALCSLISVFWGLCAMYCPWDSVTEVTENCHKPGPHKNRAAPQWPSSHCALLPKMLSCVRASKNALCTTYSLKIEFMLCISGSKDLFWLSVLEWVSCSTHAVTASWWGVVSSDAKWQGSKPNTGRSLPAATAAPAANWCRASVASSQCLF